MRIKKKQRYVPELNTSSLPDLIFTVLFFFMIVTHMRQNDVKVQVRTPKGTELLPFDRKFAVAAIYVGKDSNGEILIQLNNDIIPSEKLPSEIKRLRSELSDEEREAFTVSLKADRDIPMGVLADIKETLRSNNILHLNYSASGDEKEKNSSRAPKEN